MKIVRNLVFALQFLLGFLLVFEKHIQLPAFGEVIGRMHPLLLHLPIGSMAMLFLLHIYQQYQKRSLPSNDSLLGLGLYFNALFAVTTALAGLFLSQEGGYSEGLAIHKWTGIGFNWMAWGLLLGWEKYASKRWYGISWGIGVLVMTISGHFGGELTHGENFIFQPLNDKIEIPIATLESTVYEAAILPILNRKCFSCHNEKKSKGGLIMSNWEGIQKGGDHGPVWMAGASANSLLIQRVNLPLEDEEHMPPEGKVQLLEDEIELIEHWIDEGADEALVIGSINEEHRLYAFLEPVINQIKGKSSNYSFEPADGELLESLNTPFRRVTPLAENSPALEASIFVKAYYQTEFLEELAAVSQQLVGLNLSGLPIQDDELKVIANFQHLEKLVLNQTDITSEGIKNLANLTSLQSLALSGTNVDSKILATLEQLPNLTNLYLWNTPLLEEDFQELAKLLPKVSIDRGFQPDPNELLPLSAPVVINKEQVLIGDEKIELKHNFPGVTIRYEMDGKDPDSLSPIYEGPIEVDDYALLKASAFLEGWASSSPISKGFFRAGLPLDSVVLLTTPNPQYKGRGAATLHDNAKGDEVNFRSPTWIGYRESPFEAMVQVKEDVEVSKLVLSYLNDMGAYIMPPVYVEVYGKRVGQEWTLLNKKDLPVPTGYENKAIELVGIDIPKQQYDWIKVVAQNVTKLPKWHNGAGDLGWVFVDELFVYN
jgi:uncharacterized membrane protein